MNPYTNRHIIQNRKDFCNRKTEVTTIFSRMGGLRPQSISIVGEKKMGRSSLLCHVCDKEVRKHYLKEPRDYIFVFCNLQEEPVLDVGGFFSLVTREIALDASRYFEENLFGEATFDSFLRLVKNFDKNDKKLILALDEFEVITQNENFDLKFFSFLRALANSYNVGYITSSRKDLRELFPPASEIKSSPFFNIFTRIPLGLFDEESALELIKAPSAREGILLEEYKDFIFELAGFHPFLIQAACYNLFEYLNSHKTIDRKGFRTVKENFLNETGDYFVEGIWKNLKEEEKRCLKAIAKSEKLDRRLSFIASMLERRGFLIRDGTYKIFSKSFGE